MVATLERHGNTVAERPQQIRRPRPKRDHDMARLDRAVRKHHAPALPLRLDRRDVGLPDLAAGACQHPRIGLDHGARRVDRRGLGVQKPNFIDRQDVRLERGYRLAVEKLALDAIFRQQRLLGFGRADRVAAPCLEPAGLADALRGTSLYDPFTVQFQRGADQSVQRGGARPQTRHRRIRKEARDPVDIADRPGRIPAQRGVLVAEIFRQRVPQRWIVERRDRSAAENAGIAIGGFAAGLAPIDQHDRQALLPRGIGRRDANDAGAEYDDIRYTFHAIRHSPPPRYINVKPPSTGSIAPVRWPASGDNRKITAAATSSGSANRPSGLALAATCQLAWSSAPIRPASLRV